MAISEKKMVKALRRLASRNGGAARVEPETMAALYARGLALTNESGKALLTEAGRAFVRRGLTEVDIYAAQHRTLDSAMIIDDAEERRPVTVNIEESPLSWLRRRKGRDGQPLIGAVEFTAGERLRADYTRGQLMPRVTANWAASVAQSRRDGAGGMAEITEAAIAARYRVERALTAVGPEFGGLLVDFCCFLKGLEEIERERLWPARSAKLVLRLALASLARHYGLSETAEGKYRSTGIRHWGTTDYRPALD